MQFAKLPPGGCFYEFTIQKKTDTGWSRWQGGRRKTCAASTYTLMRASQSGTFRSRLRIFDGTGALFGDPAVSPILQLR